MAALASHTRPSYGREVPAWRLWCVPLMLGMSLLLSFWRAISVWSWLFAAGAQRRWTQHR
jgi:hypothetical protein